MIELNGFFLEKMMLKLGFDERWVRLVIMFVSSVSYHVVRNNYSIDPIIPSRGLRQGDPISPYLFFICAEGISSLIHYHTRHGRIHGYKVANGASAISHLFFADNSFLFF